MKHANDLWLEYATDVTDGNVVVPKYIKKEIERFEKDLTMVDSPDFDWQFDAETAERYIDFIQHFTKHSLGACGGQDFVLMPWQQYFLSQVFGWYHKEKGYRRYRTAYLFVARKNGKTQLAAAIAAAMMMLDKEPFGQYVFAANTKEQARIAFEEMQRVVAGPHANKHVKKRMTSTKYKVEEETYGGWSKALASDSNTLDGLNLQLAVVDEFHEQKDTKLFDVLRNSMGARQNPLMLSITTAGFIPDGPCAKAMRTAKEVLDGHKSDERTLALIYELDENDDWQDSDLWIKANPGLGTINSKEALEAAMVEARNSGGIAEFKTKLCNIFVDGDRTWIEDELWQESAEEWEPDAETPCYLGLDLARVEDVSSLAIIFDRGTEGLYVKTYHWLPKATVDKYVAKNADHIYSRIEEFDNFFVTEGDAADHMAVRDFITGVSVANGKEVRNVDALWNKYNVKALAYDPWGAQTLAMLMSQDGLECVPVTQTFKNLSEPTSYFHRALILGDLKHEPCEVMDWMIRNVQLDSDSSGNTKPSKSKSADKIDGVAASINALGDWLMSQGQEEDDGYIDNDWKPFNI